MAAFYDLAAPDVLAAGCPMRFFVGYLGGVAVSAGELFLDANAAGVYGVATKKDYRRRGIGLAMTWACANEARLPGARTAVLQASETAAAFMRGWALNRAANLSSTDNAWLQVIEHIRSERKFENPATSLRTVRALQTSI